MKEMWEILVPESFNDGNKVPLAHHRQWDAYVLDITGGLTILKTAKGLWQNPTGRFFREPMIPVRIVCSEAEIRNIGEFTKKHYLQEAVLAYLISQRVMYF